MGAKLLHNQLNNDEFSASMFRKLFFPAIITSVGVSISDMADAIVVGQKLGPAGLAAIALILPVYMLINIIGYGLSNGGAIAFGKFIGRGENENANGTFNDVFWSALCVGVIISAVMLTLPRFCLSILGTDYNDGQLYALAKEYFTVFAFSVPLYILSIVFNNFLRNDSSEKIAARGSVIGSIVDFTMNIVLVIGFNLGIKGAALATFIGLVVSIIIYSVGMVTPGHNLAIHLPSFARVSNIFRYMKLGLPSSMNYLYQLIFILVSNNILIRIGGERAVAIFDLIQNASYLILYMYEASGRSMQPLIAIFHSEYNYPGEDKVLRLGLKWGLGFGYAVIAVILIKPVWVCNLFGFTGASNIVFASWVLRWYAISQLFSGISIVLSAYFQSCEQTKASVVITTLRGILILIPSMIICSSFGEKGFWLLYPINEALSLAIFIVLCMIRNYSSLRVGEDSIERFVIDASDEAVVKCSQQAQEFVESKEHAMKTSMLTAMAIEEVSMALLAESAEKDKMKLQITVVNVNSDCIRIFFRNNAIEFNPLQLYAGDISSDDGNEAALGMEIIRKKVKSIRYNNIYGFGSIVVEI